MMCHSIKVKNYLNLNKFTDTAKMDLKKFFKYM